MSQNGRKKETWATRVGVILAVTGSAVGLGNFLRFPGLAAQYGGGVFMVPYVVAFLLIGLPIAWVEWAMGRYGGANGYNSAPGVFRAICGKRWASYLAVLGPLIPVMIYMYYVFVEAWCLGYAWNYATGQMDRGDDPAAYGEYFGEFVGMDRDGQAFTSGGSSVLVLLGICFALNFFLIYRGLQKGIEWFCKFAMPALILCAIVVLVRVLTLGAPIPDKPQQNVTNGLGYMWNPVHQPEALAAGDKVMAELIRRSTIDAAHPSPVPDTPPEFTILSSEAVAWALNKTEWKPPEDWRPPEAEPKTKTTLAPRYRHAESQAVLVIRGDVASFRAVDSGETLDDPVISLLEMLPVACAKPISDGTTVRGMTITSANDFGHAMRVIGWQRMGNPTSEPIAGLWDHEDSRLRLEIGADESEATVTLAGFLESLANPEIWLAAAGQIFFSLSVGFGIIITYSSYMNPDDDVALSSLTAAAGNGFCEVVLGGLIVIPATFVFLGPSAVANPPGTFGMGFASLPSVFQQMGAMGDFFGFLFFFLLFLAAVTSSLSMLQPAIALFEEGLGIGRKASVTLLGMITLTGATFVVYFSKGLAALDTIDFWVGNVCIFTMATVQVILFGWVLGLEKGMAEIKRGAEIPVPRFVGILVKYVSPVYLLVIMGFWMTNNLPGRLRALVEETKTGETPVMALSVGLILIMLIFFTLIISRAIARWDKQEAAEKAESEVSP